MKKILKVLLVIVITIFVFMLVGFFYIKSRPVPVVEIAAIEMSSVKDGFYVGEYESFPVKAVVNVQVKDNKILRIEIIEHENGLGKKAEAVVEEVIQTQSLKVEAVSGATHSSNVILKAVEAALQKGKI
ncbi:MAG: FMN-binding protein [Clostridia bacterium]|jgi:uncharacterized protein with FMN-binding domain|nr:FMN-binding protein [Clostridia bacterium]